MTNYDFTSRISEYIKAEKQILDSLCISDINTVMNVLENARMNKKQIFICGNGGSASTASHFQGDFNKGISYTQDIKYNVQCLSDNIPMMTAIANDIGYDSVFVVPLVNKLNLGDILIGISGSGNSENVIKAFEYAKENSAVTIAFTGYDGGKLKNIADYNVHIPIDNMQITEDVHLILNHMMMYILSDVSVKSM